MDVSGQRALSLTINDPARTAASCSAKQGDDVTMMLGGAREVRLVVPPGARIQRRQYVTRTMARDEKNQPVKDAEGKYVYDEKPYEQHVLVMPGSVTMFGRVSHIEAEEGYEGTPHTTVTVKKHGAELHFTESGELLDETSLSDLLEAALA
jgi:hypothetical protein